MTQGRRQKRPMEEKKRPTDTGIPEGPCGDAGSPSCRGSIECEHTGEGWRRWSHKRLLVDGDTHPPPRASLCGPPLRGAFRRTEKGRK